MTEETVEQLSMLDQDTWSGKTSPEHSAPTKEKTSESYSKKQRKSLTKMPLFLDLRRESGQHQDASWQMGGALLGEYSMHSFGESPKEGVESYLSQILEDNPHPKYCLSAKACQGILTRANRRGKKLPPVLQEALEQMIETESTALNPEQLCEGGGKGALVQTNKSAAVVYALDRASFNQGKNAQFDIGISEEGVAHTVIAKGPGAVAYAIDQQGGKGMCGCAEDICPTILSDSHGTPHAVVYWDGSQTCGTLTANNAGGNQRMPDKDNFNCVVQVVDCRNCSENNVNGSLQSNMAHSLNGNNVVRVRYIVRRLTPLECERLQGYPDGWTDIGEWTDSNGRKRQTSDAARYKALGNSIALPSWKWVLKRICGCYERDATLGSLFDGIGGFGYLWQQINGKGSCLWASEIEEFCISVTKKRIGD